jgi:hypothetical protein
MQLKWWHVVLITFYVADLSLLHYYVFYRPVPPVVTNNIIQPTAAPVDTCGPECQKYINNKISSIPTPSAIVVAAAAAKKSKVRTVSYLPISNNGSTGSNNWDNLSGTDFYFDLHDYPGLVEIYFETNIKLFNGNGLAFVRLYDETHGVGVQGSEVQTSQQKDTAVVSGQVSFYQGKNLIKVQAKSLTADTAIFTSGRLKIVTEN